MKLLLFGIAAFTFLISCKPSTEKKEKPTINREQIKEASAVQEEPVFETEADAKLALMQGNWYSTEDAASYLKITDDQLLMGYEGSQSHLDTYTITIVDKLPENQPSNPDTQYLILTQAGDSMSYAIDELTEDSLRLLYLPRGNFLTYSRTKQKPL
ncbi:hypothetical protein [Leeuwenhoekiella sp. NPDC079379]|uniref:hypothetical protein n=1 Tax=Leeuwenhoekiella sp. NPDC079379 TaxID=3364122 RepID=UPI0037CC97BA